MKPRLGMSDFDGSVKLGNHGFVVELTSQALTGRAKVIAPTQVEQRARQSGQPIPIGAGTRPRPRPLPNR